MSDTRETSLDHIAGEAHATIFTTERKWLNHISKLKGKFPDEVKIHRVNTDGSMVAHIPAGWFKITPKRKQSLSEEQINASRIRLEAARQKRLNQSTQNAVGEQDGDG